MAIHIFRVRVYLTSIATLCDLIVECPTITSLCPCCLPLNSPPISLYLQSLKGALKTKKNKGGRASLSPCPVHHQPPHPNEATCRCVGVRTAHPIRKNRVNSASGFHFCSNSGTLLYVVELPRDTTLCYDPADQAKGNPIKPDQVGVLWCRVGRPASPARPVTGTA